LIDYKELYYLVIGDYEETIGDNKKIAGLGAMN
jgi:hypothetical protein